MLNNLKIFVKRYGPAKGLAVYNAMKFNTSGKLKLPSIKHPIRFKPKTIDEYTIIEIFGEACYSIDFDFEPKLIIDAGANIGLGAVYFTNRYPSAKIIAIEPEANNYRQLLENCNPYRQINPLQSAVWNKSTYVKIEDNGYGTRGFMISETSKEEKDAIKAIAIEDLVTQHEIIDILKLDIEGSEKALFEEGFENWLPRTRAIIIELHDNMVPNCSETVYNTINKYNFTSFQKEENIIFINKDLP